MGKDSILGNWLKTKKGLLKIKSNLFVAGSISSTLLNKQFTISEINNMLFQYYGTYFTVSATNRDRHLLFGNYGLWNCQNLEQEQILKACKAFNVEQIISTCIISKNINQKLSNIVEIRNNHCLVLNNNKAQN